MKSVGLRFIRRAGKRVLPAPIVRLGRRLQRYLYGYGWRTPGALGPLPAAASPALATVYRAWRLAATSPANQVGLCYYGVEFEGFPLPGERPWDARWRMLRDAAPWRGARVLELGCNLGLLSVFALRAGAEAALGVEGDGVIVEASRLVQQAYGVAYRVEHRNFNDPGPWEEELAAFRPTIVTALSVLNWVADQDRFAAFLGRFDTVLFEGHESEGVERRRLQAVGLTDITLVGRSEHGRAVLLARKPPRRPAAGPGTDLGQEGSVSGAPQPDRAVCGTS
jgi:hypothetical protein